MDNEVRELIKQRKKNEALEVCFSVASDELSRKDDEIAELRGHLRSMVDESMHLAEFKNKTLRASIRSTDLDEPELHDYQTIAEADEYLSKTANK